MNEHWTLKKAGGIIVRQLRKAWSASGHELSSLMASVLDKEFKEEA